MFRPNIRNSRMEFQTRNDIGDIRIYEHFRDAYNSSIEDSTIWKISFRIDDINYRWVKKIPSDLWSEKIEKKLNSLSEKYLINRENMNFWVYQKVFADDYDEIMSRRDISYSEKVELNQLNCIIDVLTEEQFKRTFNQY